MSIADYEIEEPDPEDVACDDCGQVHGRRCRYTESLRADQRYDEERER